MVALFMCSKTRHVSISPDAPFQRSTHYIVLFLSPLKSIKERQVGWWINAVGDQKIKKKRKILEMKNMKKKGFTLVELVIVIAVIAILAGVLIGTFSTVITRANQSKALQLLRTEITEIEMVHAMSGYVM